MTALLVHFTEFVHIIRYSDTWDFTSNFNIANLCIPGIGRLMLEHNLQIFRTFLKRSAIFHLGPLQQFRRFTGRRTRYFSNADARRAPDCSANAVHT